LLNRRRLVDAGEGLECRSLFVVHLGVVDLRLSEAVDRTVPVRPSTVAPPGQVAFAATAAKHKSTLAKLPEAVVDDRSNAGARLRQSTS
jgi:hypothetical protein